MTATMADVLDGPAAFTKWPAMTRAQRAHAAWLLLQVRWPGVTLDDLPRLASYDKHSGQVMVQREPGRLNGHATWAPSTKPSEVYLDRIARRCGSEACARAERIIDAPERREDVSR